MYYELLKIGETVNGERYRQQKIKLNEVLMGKRSEWAIRCRKVSLLHDNALPHTSKIVQNNLKSLNRDVLSHPSYSPDLSPFHYHLFRPMVHRLAEEHLANFEEVQNRFMVCDNRRNVFLERHP